MEWVLRSIRFCRLAYCSCSELEWHRLWRPRKGNRIEHLAESLINSFAGGGGLCLLNARRNNCRRVAAYFGWQQEAGRRQRACPECFAQDVECAGVPRAAEVETRRQNVRAEKDLSLQNICTEQNLSLAPFWAERRSFRYAPRWNIRARQHHD